MKTNHVVGAIIVLIIVAGGSFYAGTSYAKGKAPARGQFAAGGTGAAGFAGRGGAGAGGARGGFTAGQIVSASNGSISIQQQNGSSSEIVLISPSTQILKTVAGSASDLTQGTQVTVTGSANADGSMSASSIQIRPAGMTMPGARVQ